MATQLTSDSNFDFDLVPLNGGSVADTSSTGLPVFDLNSQEPLPEFTDDLGSRVSATPPKPEILRETEESIHLGGDLWLEGDVLMCACPDCSAPMAVRLWLMVADCWQCGTSIELTEEQEREAMRLMQHRERQLEKQREAAATKSATRPKPTPASSDASASEDSAKAPPAARMRSPEPQPAPDANRTPTQRRTPSAAPSPQRPPGRSPVPPAGRLTSPQPQRRSAAENLNRRRLQKRRSRGWLAALLHDTPAWLVSAVLHMVALTLLALLTLPGDDDSKYITLNAHVSKDLRRAGETEIKNPADEVEFDLPIPEEIDIENKQTREAMVRADQDARELRIVDTANPSLPNIAAVKSAIRSHSGTRAPVAARDPRVRVEVLKQEGGTTLTEAAVARGLRYLAGEQESDGRWQLSGGMRSDSAGTSLALMPFLGAGQTHLSGRYKDNVASGLRWLVLNQKENGDLRAGSSGNSGMYAHGQAAIVLCEAFLMTGDEELRVPAQKAIDFIVAAQYPDGGWRYKPNFEASSGERRSDTSVVGWQLMALQSARAANLTVPEETFELCSHYLDSARAKDGVQYCYQPNHRPSHVMTAEALLCRVYLGTMSDDPYFADGVDYLAKNHLPSAGDPNMYYWYYATQLFHHVGGPKWERWNLRMRDVLVNTQEKGGRYAGSWTPRGGHAAAGGRIYMTSLAICSLEVYYRHLPIFRQIDME